ncbi:MAG: hypothetical protein IJ192_09885 [Clostridia bacterium]|nr:hypothetical protein [Clostridia bacterium]
MWKRADKKTAEILRSKIRGSYAAVHIFFAMILVVIGLVFYSKVGKYQYIKEIVIDFSVLAFCGAVIFVIAAAVSHFQWKKIEKKLDTNNAMYHEAILVKKSHHVNTDPKLMNTFDVTVSLCGKKTNIKAVREVFTDCDIGEKIYVIDLIGEEAKYPSACVAVKTPEQPEARYSREEFGRIVDGILDGSIQPPVINEYEEGTRYSQAETNSDSPQKPQKRMINSEEQEQFIRQEKHQIHLYLAAIFLLLSLNVLLPWLTCLLRNTNNINFMAICCIGIILCSVVLCLFFAVLVRNSQKIKKCNKNIKELGSENVMCRTMTYKSSDYVKWTRRKQEYKMYYHTCLNENGRREVIESESSCRAEPGQKVCAVYFQNGDIKLYSDK